MTWLIYVSISVILFTIMNLLQRVLAVNSNDQRAASVVYNLSAASIAIFFYFVTGAYQKFALPVAPLAYISLFVGIVSYGLYERIRFVGAKLLDASTLTVFSVLGVAIAYIGSIFLYQEPITFLRVIGSMLIISAVLIVSIGHTSSSKKSVSSYLIGLATSICIGFALMVDKNGTKYFNPDTYSIFVWVLPLLIVIFPGISTRKLAVEFRLGSWKLILLALINVLAYMAFLRALTLADATLVMPLGQMSTILTIIFGALLLHERDQLKMKLLAGLLAVAGASMLI